MPFNNSNNNNNYRKCFLLRIPTQLRLVDKQAKPQATKRGRFKMPAAGSRLTLRITALASTPNRGKTNEAGSQRPEEARGNYG